MLNKGQKIRLLVLIILYAVGFVGIGVFQSEIILTLTPINLLLSLLLILPKNTNTISVAVFCTIYLLGISAEILGVSTGFPFGTYVYGASLGPQIAEVPIIIGLNWILVSYTSWFVVVQLKLNRYIKLLLATALMVFLDSLIEPLSSVLDFWHWKDAIIPLQNYISWFIIGLVCIFLLESFLKEKQNNLAKYLFVIQLLFFGGLNILL